MNDTKNSNLPLVENENISSERRPFDSYGGIWKYDGYVGKPLFVAPNNYSTYYNEVADTQCRVPLKESLEELRKELGLISESEDFIEKEPTQEKVLSNRC